MRADLVIGHFDACVVAQRGAQAENPENRSRTPPSSVAGTGATGHGREQSRRPAPARRRRADNRRSSPTPDRCADWCRRASLASVPRGVIAAFRSSRSSARPDGRRRPASEASINAAVGRSIIRWCVRMPSGRSEGAIAEPARPQLRDKRAKRRRLADKAAVATSNCHQIDMRHRERRGRAAWRLGEAIAESAQCPVAAERQAVRRRSGSTAAPRPAARAARTARRAGRLPAAISAATSAAGRRRDTRSFCRDGAVRVAPAVLQHRDARRAGAVPPPARAPPRPGSRPAPAGSGGERSNSRKLRGRGDRVVVAPPQRRDPARLAPAIEFVDQIGPIRGRRAPRRRRRNGARHRLPARRHRLIARS